MRQANHGRLGLDAGSAVVCVRKSTVVWQAQVSSARNRLGFPTSEARAELTRYALEQGNRVGGGSLIARRERS